MLCSRDQLRKNISINLEFYLISALQFYNPTLLVDFITISRDPIIFEYSVLTSQEIHKDELVNAVREIVAISSENHRKT
jgi:hypothetical protein